MVALTVTPANVVPAATATIRYYKALAAITPGQAVYFDALNNGVNLADADNTVATAAAIGISVGQAAAAGQTIGVCIEGEVAFGAILTAGRIYVLGTTPGAIHPVADLIATWRSTIIGYGISATVMYIKPVASGVVHG
jgi:hypothetical protein